MNLNLEDLEKLVQTLKALEGCSILKSKKSEHPFIGAWCIIRTYSAGVFFGKLEDIDDSTAFLGTVRRLWQWAGACSLSQLAMEGTKAPGDCRFAMPVEKMQVLGVIEVIPYKDSAIKSISEVPIWKK